MKIQKKIFLATFIFWSLFSQLSVSDIIFKSKRDNERGEIYVMSDNGRSVRRLTETPFYKGGAAWSSDGKQIVFDQNLNLEPGRGQQYDIFVMNADGNHLRQITHHPRNDGNGAWSPKGQHIVWTSSRTGTLEIHVMDLANREIQQLTDIQKLNGFASGPRWSPDGKQFVYEVTLRNKGRSIYIMNADGTDSRPLFKNLPIGNGNNWIERGAPRWSPDGNHILYLESEYGIADGVLSRISDRLIITDVFTARPQQELDIPTEWRVGLACWSAHGRHVLFHAKTKGTGNLEIYRYNLFTHEITNLTNHPADDLLPDWTSYGLSVSPTGKITTQWAEIKKEK